MLRLTYKNVQGIGKCLIFSKLQSLFYLYFYKIIRSAINVISFVVKKIKNGCAENKTSCKTIIPNT